MPTSQSIPDLHRLIIAGRGNASTVGGPSYLCHTILMTGVDVDALPDVGVPHLYCSIIATRGDIPCIRRPCDTPYRLGMTSVLNDISNSNVRLRHPPDCTSSASSDSSKSCE